MTMSIKHRSSLARPTKRALKAGVAETAARSFRNGFNESFKWFAETNAHGRSGTAIAYWPESLRARLEWYEGRRARRAVARSLAVK
jgi:hypothetical protein